MYLCREECYEKMIRSCKWRRAREWLERVIYKRVEGVEVQFLLWLVMFLVGVCISRSFGGYSDGVLGGDGDSIEAVRNTCLIIGTLYVLACSIRSTIYYAQD